MNRILFLSNISYRIDAFSKAAILVSKKMQIEFHYASNWAGAEKGQIEREEQEYSITIHNVEIERNPFSLKNRQAFQQIKEIIKEQNIGFIHCNTPTGGLIGRLVRKNVKKVIYEAHGFHFYKGAPLKNWLLYYPVEKILAHRTDAIITINKDDYEFALKHLHPRSRIYYVPGVGIELEKWQGQAHQLRAELGFRSDDFLILAVGRLEKNKNCRTIIDAVSQIEDKRVRLVFCGDGEDRRMLEAMVREKDLEDRVFFLGNRNDMVEIYHMADCFVSASFREGLSRSIMEAMACGLPCIVSNIRGNRDLIDEKGGFLFDPHNAADLVLKIEMLYNSNDLQAAMKINNLDKIREFSLEKVVDELTKVYIEQFDLEDK